MPPTTYVARQPGPFSALLQARDLGGFRLQALPPRRVNDRYEDTDDGALLAQGLTLRLREQEGEWTATLRPIRRGVAGPVSEASYGVAWTPPEGQLPLPPGELAEAVRRIVGTDPVAPLIRLRQYRTPRLAYDGTRLVALLSFDVVVYEVPGAHVVSNELEVERAQSGTEADLRRLAPVLLRHGMEPVGLTKLERGIMRVHRSLDEPVLLLPEERAALETYIASSEPMMQRRARVVQLDARGYRALTIAGQVGLSTSRVRHWQQAFREHRMGIFRPAEEPDGLVAPVVPSYRVSEIVDRGDGSAPAESRPTESRPPEPSSVDADDSPARPTSVGDGSPSQVPFAEGPTVAIPVSPMEPSRQLEETDELATRSAPDEALDVEQAEDMAELLEMFQPAETETPLLAEEDSEEADDGSPEALEQTSEPGEQRASPAHSQDPPSHRRSFLAPDTPILSAAHDTLVHYIGGFNRAAQQFQAAPIPRSAQRLLLAAHRVRLAIEAFQSYVPEAAAARLIAALRPLAAALDHAVELERVRQAGSGDAATALDEALDVATRHLTPERHRIWMERAARLTGRLAEQLRSGLLIGDDFPLVSDDWVGQPGDRPMPSRLRHILASVVWERYESVRAFQDEVGEGLTPLTAHHLAVAVSGLHFALGLVSKASDPTAVREAASQLDEAERVVAAFRTATHRHSKDMPEADVQQAWASLEDVAFRQLLGTITASI
ncbi:MAG: CYTH domain-containing protein [Bacteroidota bacterium]